MHDRSERTAPVGTCRPRICTCPLALFREAKVALVRGASAVGTATCSGEGGILPAEQAAADHYIFEIAPSRYSVTDENLQAADAIEIKIGQGTKPGMGGHLPGAR